MKMTRPLAHNLMTRSMTAVAAAGLGLLFAASADAATNILYTFESPDSGTTVSDRLTDDGAQDPIFDSSGVTVDTNAANAAFGSQSVSFIDDGNPNRIEIPSTTDLGSAFTLAAAFSLDASKTDPGIATRVRLFTSYNVDGVAGDLIVTIDSADTDPFDNGVELWLNGTEIKPTSIVPIEDDGNTYHHIAVTYDDGSVKIYFDGTELDLNTNTAGSGSVTLAQNVHFGEDGSGTNLENEQFGGNADDILVLDRALSAEEVAKLANKGAGALLLPSSKGTVICFQ
ncbi:MAG: LamG domain-containing protein [Kiritimatiellia bacterium]